MSKLLGQVLLFGQVLRGSFQAFATSRCSHQASWHGHELGGKTRCCSQRLSKTEETSSGVCAPALPLLSMEKPPAKRQRRGGQRQRLQRAAEEARGGEVCQSMLLQYLLTCFAWGVQRIAALAVADFEKSQSHPEVLQDLSKCASIGFAGVYSNKCHSDLMRLVEHTTSMGPLRTARVPFKAPVGEKEVAFLLPPELFSRIYHFYPDTWNKSILPSTSELRDSWQAQDGHKQMIGHPVRARNGYEHMCLPIGVHGDDVPITGSGKGWMRKMTQFSWCSLLGRGSTQDMLFWIHGIFVNVCVGDHSAGGTLTTWWSILKWSLQALFDGRWPAADWNGCPHLALG